MQANSPAKKAGFQSGDTILSVDGKPVKSPRDLASKIASIKPGEKPEIEIVRDSKKLTKTVKIASLPGKKKVAALKSKNERALQR